MSDRVPRRACLTGSEGEPLLGCLEGLAREVGHPVVLVHAPIDDQAIKTVYECLRPLGCPDRLGIVLHTLGGSISAGRRLALIARESCRTLVLMVPYKARSAGTLVCLAAEELVLGPMAELSPVDAQISSASPGLADPDGIGIEDVRAFRSLAEEWFGVTSDDDRIQVLTVLAKSVFPPTLGSMFRIAKYSKSVTAELLRLQLPVADTSRFDAAVDALLGTSTVHDGYFSRADIAEMGLNVVESSIEVEGLMWELVYGLQDFMDVDPSLLGVVARPGYEVHRCWLAGNSDRRIVGGAGDPNGRIGWTIAHGGNNASGG